MNSVTSTVPGTATFDTSFLARSTSIRCSARSFGSASSSSASAASASGVSPRGREPAIGCIVMWPAVTFTSASGLEPTIAYGSPEASDRLSRYMYGLGLSARSTR